MIGLDTNVLLRVFIDDDPQQAAAARRFILNAAPSGLLVSDLVLAEMVWTLGRRLKASRASIIEVLERILERSEFILENRQDIRDAVRIFARTRVDFGDCLIAVRNRRHGATRTVSLDEDSIEASVFDAIPS